jgi:hypothetical protein
MTRDDILRMARETRLVPKWLELCKKDEEALGRFFHAAYAAGAAAEREACAKLAESTVCDTHLPTGVRIYGTRAAAAIRARTP